MINTVIEVSRGNYRDIAEETVTEDFMEQMMPEFSVKE